MAEWAVLLRLAAESLLALPKRRQHPNPAWHSNDLQISLRSPVPPSLGAPDVPADPAVAPPDTRRILAVAPLIGDKRCYGEYPARGYGDIRLRAAAEAVAPITQRIGASW